MIDLLNRYCLDNTNNTGLLLLDMPTGTGKTYNVLQFIKSYLRQNKDKKIFFVTTLKKNLDAPYHDLIKDLDNEPELKDSVFRVLSNTEYAFKHFNDIKKKINNKDIRNSEEFKNFDALISAGVYRPEIFRDIEKRFRYLIGRVLSRRFKTKSEKINAIKNDKDWQWIGDLYPIVFSEEKRVFFITMKKLINKYDTIIEKSVRLFESPIFKNSIVFIDEFDATKKDIQDMIVQNNLNKGIDYIDLFRNIKICLDNHKSIPSNIFDNIENKPSHKHALEKNKKIFDDIAQKYHLLQHHKSEGFEENRIILFSDYTHNNYITGKDNVISTFDEKKNINMLQVVPEEKSNRSLYEALDKIKGAISHFARFVTILAYSYRKNKIQNREEGKTYGEFTELHALDTILDSLHLQGESNRIIRDIAITYNSLQKGKCEEKELKDDLFFYSSGFSHYDFSDDYSHDNTTIIRKFIFEETPESILYTICTLSKVVGISATATFKTVLGNFDIEYLKWKLGNKFVLPTNEDKQRLIKAFKKQTEGFDKVETIVELTNTSGKEPPNWSNIYRDNEVAYEAHNITNDNNNIYKEVRYYKAVLAFKQFLDNNIQSYLALFSKSLTPNDSDFNSEILFKLYKYLALEKEIDYQENICIVLDSDNFEEKKENLIEDLSNGKRKFIISTYATIGAGQNLQYKIPNERKDDVIKLNNYRDNSTEMDIEGIYLDKPTALINQLKGDEESAINRVFQMEYLCQVNAISTKNKIAEIGLSYNSVCNDQDKIQQSYFNFSNLRDVKVYATKTIVQAMGRKCRTNNRSRKIFIMADSELKDLLDKKTLFEEERMFNQEMIKLSEKFSYTYSSKDTQESTYTEIAKKDAIISNKRIQNLLTRCFNYTWNETDIQLWQNMREYALKHPTLSKNEWENSPFRNHYITLGYPVCQYYYTQTGDYDSIHELSQNNFKDANFVSAEDANLTKILGDFKKLKDFFISQGYATVFTKNDYIMAPPFYQNIYKGAIGEAVGKEIFKHYNIPLEELKKEEYEMFDYKVIGKPIYVDFKYWKESSRLDAGEYRKKVKEKAAKCNKVETIIIANVRDTGCNLINETNMGTFNIIELSLIVNSGLSKEAAEKIKTLK